MSKIIKAAQFAADCHNMQRRKYNGKPYITHPCRVAGRFATHPLASEDGVCAAYLHDVVEDCGVTLDEIQERFGVVVRLLVNDLTNPSKGSKEPRAIRKQIDREHAAKISDTAKIIKLIDRIDNLNEIDPADKFAKLYCDESAALLEVIGGADEQLAKELADAITAVQDAHNRAFS